MTAESHTVYTLGHSNHDLTHFLDLLMEHKIDVVVDVRSKPFSKYAKQFNKAELEAFLTEYGLAYRFLGRELGGLPQESAFYDAKGHVLYGPLSQSGEFRRGLEELMGLIRSGKRVTLMCGEESPLDCHRRLLIGRMLAGMNVEIMHILGDGRLVDDAHMDEAKPEQLSLLDSASSWRSSKPVPPAKRPS